jgi:acetyl/propionyl-CoA carboxylase alpha subunit
MTDEYEAQVDGRPIVPATDWTFAWIDATAGVARLTDGSRTWLIALEGAGSDWIVTLHGRRIPVTVRSWRERVLAEVAGATRAHIGPLDITATLPGLIVAVAVAAGQDVSEGDALITIEAMKMQNEVLAPRGGRIAAVAVEAGQTVATGALLVRIEDRA